MPKKKIPVIELDLLDPNLTRKRKFACGECEMVYSLKHYRILYEVEKLSYFQIKEVPKVVVCHQCLYKFADRFKEKLDVKKIILKINSGEDEVTVKF